MGKDTEADNITSEENMQTTTISSEAISMIDNGYANIGGVIVTKEMLDEPIITYETMDIKEAFSYFILMINRVYVHSESQEDYDLGMKAFLTLTGAIDKKFKFSEFVKTYFGDEKNYDRWNEVLAARDVSGLVYIINRVTDGTVVNITAEDVDIAIKMNQANALAGTEINFVKVVEEEIKNNNEEDEMKFGNEDKETVETTVETEEIIDHEAAAMEFLDENICNNEPKKGKIKDFFKRNKKEDKKSDDKEEAKDGEKSGSKKEDKDDEKKMSTITKVGIGIAVVAAAGTALFLGNKYGFDEIIIVNNETDTAA